MISNLPLAISVGVMASCGVVLLLERGIVRSFIGIILMGNAVNLLFLAAGGAAGKSAIVGMWPVSEMSDPLPQAMVLTAIVITLALTGFVMALAHRAWQLSSSDIITDDDEDARIARRAAENDMSESDYAGDLDEPDPGDDPDPGGHHPARGENVQAVKGSSPEDQRDGGPR
ncbi:Na(+)/H(+) antiporter subunit C [Dermatophilus congolensis]|uniref:Na(+)/H(+) antiporter subunit C n=1 Tax=Dermatophilus congolensis TaxID=1863 RepID=UPI001AAF06B4|nr:Na(+)/H(+) antiporter subunit C [Dermatophilus congolensis]MBO3151651.1 Na(+)/H(+) antiporter subunit C [Dermatophilus congolensis]MBO3161349.1 Na(+)/H(+) antiporter subunit C [Dermatophilus congolensis]MBO3162932.1 Na(+)/H(+) antiporter subunit C [Dermatophilus congolensis]MBO3176484.1 Na(+)/H(+) antiporter subunit C [Dermatophilus congolensis]